MNPPAEPLAPNDSGQLIRQLGLFGTTMAVMGGIIGAGIFINPYLVAQRVQTAPLILGAWVAGGLIALAGGFIYAELAARLPVVGGQYAYLREALHPAVAFVYGWVLLLVIQTGGMAAVAVIFARYFLDLTQWPMNDSFVAAGALALLTAINCLGVRAGSRVQSTSHIDRDRSDRGAGRAQLFARRRVANGMAPAAGSAAIIASRDRFWRGHDAGPLRLRRMANVELSRRRSARRGRILPHALILGVLGVIAVYVSVNFVYLRALGPEGLAATSTPASSVMRELLGAHGGAIDRSGDRVFRFRISRAIDPDRAAGLFRDGPGRRLFSQRGVGASAHPCAGASRSFCKASGRS